MELRESAHQLRISKNGKKKCKSLTIYFRSEDSHIWIKNTISQLKSNLTI